MIYIGWLYIAGYVLVSAPGCSSPNLSGRGGCRAGTSSMLQTCTTERMQSDGCMGQEVCSHLHINVLHWLASTRTSGPCRVACRPARVVAIPTQLVVRWARNSGVTAKQATDAIAVAAWLSATVLAVAVSWRIHRAIRQVAADQEWRGVQAGPGPFAAACC